MTHSDETTISRDKVYKTVTDVVGCSNTTLNIPDSNVTHLYILQWKFNKCLTSALSVF